MREHGTISGADSTPIARIVVLGVCGTAVQIPFRPSDTYRNFRNPLVSIIDYAPPGVRTFPFSETEELMTVPIANLRSHGVELAARGVVITSRLSL